MIAALVLAVIGLVLALGLPAPWCLFAFVVIPPAVWLMSGGGERWMTRRTCAADADTRPEEEK